MNSKTKWYSLIILMFLLFVLEYSPLIIPTGKYKPILFGMPYSLWLGIIGASLGVFLTYLAAKVHSKAFSDEE